MKFKFKFNVNKEPLPNAADRPAKVEVHFKVNDQEVSAKEGMWDLLHPDRVAEKMLRERVANVTCQWHPIQCRHYALKVSGGKLKLENVCCDAFRQKILQAIQNQPSQDQAQTS